jgi:FlaA1/EpsC-like NDP-sugar epimerase
MTIPESVVIAIQAGGMGKGGDVFVLDMGEPVRIDVTIAFIIFVFNDLLHGSSWTYLQGFKFYLYQRQTV